MIRIDSAEYTHIGYKVHQSPRQFQPLTPPGYRAPDAEHKNHLPPRQLRHARVQHEPLAPGPGSSRLVWVDRRGAIPGDRMLDTGARSVSILLDS